MIHLDLSTAHELDREWSERLPVAQRSQQPIEPISVHHLPPE
jgi:hypothetical protein